MSRSQGWEQNIPASVEDEDLSWLFSVPFSLDFTEPNLPAMVDPRSQSQMSHSLPDLPLESNQPLPEQGSSDRNQRYMAHRQSLRAQFNQPQSVYSLTPPPPSEEQWLTRSSLSRDLEPLPHASSSSSASRQARNPPALSIEIPSNRASRSHSSPALAPRRSPTPPAQSRRRAPNRPSTFRSRVNAENRLILQLRDERQLTWREVTRILGETFGREYRMPAVQMRYGRLQRDTSEQRQETRDSSEEGDEDVEMGEG
ncbi:MAG: hypothetical protein M1828_002046 [Chrysothrix sp. TS-e1954]|nr:MAG: hypothetical protein M1828_002046 [Chrysothrix sp. TS-e1954]